MTRLQGEFAVLVIFSAPDDVKPSALSTRLKALEKSRGLAVNVKPLAGKETRAPARLGPACLVSVYGADQPGIVYRVTDLLARLKVNVTDLSTHRTEARDKKSGYILYVEGETPRGLDLSRLEQPLQDLSEKMGVTISVKPIGSAPL
jgi:glycine cleavage system transcriptional repressor